MIQDTSTLRARSWIGLCWGSTVFCNNVFSNIYTGDFKMWSPFKPMLLSLRCVQGVWQSLLHTVTIFTSHTHTHTTGQCRKDTMKPRFKTWMAFRPFHGQKYHYSNLECLQLPLQIKYRSGLCTDVLFPNNLMLRVVTGQYRSAHLCLGSSRPAASPCPPLAWTSSVW